MARWEPGTRTETQIIFRLRPRPRRLTGSIQAPCPAGPARDTLPGACRGRAAAVTSSDRPARGRRSGSVARAPGAAARRPSHRSRCRQPDGGGLVAPRLQASVSDLLSLPGVKGAAVASLSHAAEGPPAAATETNGAATASDRTAGMAWCLVLLGTNKALKFQGHWFE